MDKFKTYAAHGLAYLLSIATALSGAGLIPPQYALAAGIVGAVLTGGANMVTAGMPVPGSITTNVAKSLMVALLVGPLLGLIGACSTLAGIGSGGLAQSVATQYATAKYIEAAPVAERADRAAKVVTVAGYLKSLTTNEASTVASLKDAALAVVAKAQLALSDRVLANTLVAAVADELEARVAKGVLSDADKVKVAKVLDDVTAAASAYR